MKKQVKRFIFALMMIAFSFGSMGPSKAEDSYDLIRHSGDDGIVEWKIVDESVFDCKLIVGPSVGSNGVMTDYDSPFADCNGRRHPEWFRYMVKYLMIEEGITHIGDYAFFGDGIDVVLYGNLEIPDSVTSIGKYAFAENHYLRYVTIPNSVTYIGDNAFHSGTIIICNSGSYAEQYAKKNGLKYSLSDMEIKLSKSKVTTTKGKKIKIQVLDKKTGNPVECEYDKSTSNSEIAYYDSDGNISVCGYGKVTITFSAGKSKEKCVINSVPVKIKVKSVKSSKKKSITVKWDASKVSGNYGVDIYVSKDKKFKKGVKKLQISDNMTYSAKEGKYIYKDSYKINGLKSKKTYYVKLRAYAYSNGKKICGSFSTAKKVKVK